MTYDVHKGTIPHRGAVVLSERSTIKALPNEVQYLNSGDVLTHSELGH